MKTDYVVVSSNLTTELSRQVIEYLSRGYKLAGGLTVVKAEFSDTRYMQAVYKDECAHD